MPTSGTGIGDRDHGARSDGASAAGHGAGGDVPVLYPGESPSVREEATDLGQRFRRIQRIDRVVRFLLYGVVGVLFLVLAGGIALVALVEGPSDFVLRYAPLTAGLFVLFVALVIPFELPVIQHRSQFEFVTERSPETVREEIREGYVPYGPLLRAGADEVRRTEEGLVFEYDRLLRSLRIEQVVGETDGEFEVNFHRNGTQYASATLRVVPDGDGTTVDVEVVRTDATKGLLVVVWGRKPAKRVLDLAGYEVVEATTKRSIRGVVPLPTLSLG